MARPSSQGVSRSQLQLASESLRRISAGLILRGDTFRHRKRLYDLDGIYHPVLRAWLMPNVQIMLKLKAVPRDKDFYLPPPKSHARKD